MLKKFSVIVTACLLLVSCATANYVNSNSVITSTTLSVEEKFTALGINKYQAYDTEVYFDGKQWADRLKQLIENSKSYILMTSFLASDSEENAYLYDALIKKAQEGVDVYLVFDSMSYEDYTDTKFHLRQIAFLKDHGVHIIEFNPLAVSRLIKPVSMFLREHRKMFIFDGNTIALGGMNLSYISNIALSDGGQRDSMYCLKSEDLALALKKDFIDYWNSISYEEIKDEDLKDIKIQQQGKGVSCWLSNQYLGKTSMAEILGSLFYCAKEQIRILPLYPIPDDGMYQWVKDAYERGVDMEILIPNDHLRPGQKASMFVEKNFLEHGMKLRQEKDNQQSAHLLHEKLFVVDSRYVVVGSINFNHRSMMLSQEIALVIDDPELAKMLVEHYEEFCENSFEITPEIAEENHNFKNAIFFPIIYFGG